MFDYVSSDQSAFGESLPQQIAKQIISRLLTGELRSGDKIVEDEISKELNISRAPVREAIYLLQMGGIVEKLPRRGTIVKTFTNNEIREYTDVMTGLVDLSFQFSAEKWKQLEQISLLQRQWLELDAEFQKQELIPYQKNAQRFLRYIIAAADNKALNRFFEETAQILIVFATVNWTAETMAHYHAKMSELVSAVQALDFKRAASIVSEAMRETLI